MGCRASGQSSRSGKVEAALVGPPVVADHREPVSPANPYYLKDMPIPARDVAKAKALLAEASAPKPEVAFMVPNGSEGLQVAQVVQAMAGEAGFDMRIQATEFASSLELAAKGDFDAYLIGWSGRLDPDGNIYNFVSCKAPPALNPTHYCHQDVDAALDAARILEARADRLAQRSDRGQGEAQAGGTAGRRQ